MNRPKWMNDPSLSGIPKEKLDFLSEMFDKVKDKNKKEWMPFLMSMSGKTKQNMKFTPDEMQLVIAAIKKASTAEEQARMEKLLDTAIKKSRTGY